jgi:hypothetical protein
MAYCIFYKSLRILEEFWKHPCVQIPSKSSCRNSQNLAKFRNLFKSENPFSYLLLAFSPAGLTGLLGLFGRTSPAGFFHLQPSRAGTAATILIARCHAMAVTLPSSRAMERPNNRPLLNSVACSNSIVNPPLFTLSNRVFKA